MLTPSTDLLSGTTKGTPLAHSKRNVFAALGWVVWQALAKIGVPMAKNKIKNSGGRRRKA